MRLIPDLYSLSFEQLNQLWGSLGGKQVPFVMYRARLVAIEAKKRQGEGEVITGANGYDISEMLALVPTSECLRIWD